MGLDMYLDRYPRYKHYGPREYCEYESWKKYFSGERTLAEHFKMNELEPPTEEDVKKFDSFMHETYSAWDDEHRHPYTQIEDNVMYWRKANAIHQYFVNRVQHGEDDCGLHDEVTQQILEELRDKCKAVLENAIMVNGKIKNGARMTMNGWTDIWKEGFVVINPQVCHKELPTQSGFFFGNTDYNEHYIWDIRQTYEACEKILKETDFEKQMLFYVSSW